MLTNVKVKNFTSLRSVDVPMGNLNVLVGHRGTGKTNFIKSLVIANDITLNSNYYDSIQFIQDSKDVVFDFKCVLNGNDIEYRQKIQEHSLSEFMRVNDEIVIDLVDGNGYIKGLNESEHLAYSNKEKMSCLKECYQYGDKPNIKAFADFMVGWNGYEYQDGNSDAISSAVFWVRDNSEYDFESLSFFTKDELGFELSFLETETGLRHVFADYGNYKTHLSTLSEGELRLLAMKINTFDNYLDSTSLMAIIAPESGLDVDGELAAARMVSQIAETTQVVVETHSSLFLDALHQNAKDLNLLFFVKTANAGTQIFTLDSVLKTHNGLEGWIIDFGLGSAVFDSGMIDFSQEGT